MISKERVWVLIPAFNEASNIGSVLDQIAEYNFGGCIVVDDGSTDNTQEVVRKRKVILLRHPVNQGVGAALRTGLTFAKQSKVEWVLQIDADGQHSLGSISDLLTHVHADLTVGTRDWDKYQFGKARKFAQQFLLFTLHLNGVKGVNDPTSGFRLFGKKAINFYSESMPPNFIGDTVEALILGFKEGLVIESQVVEMSPRQFGRSSHTGWRIVKAFLVACLYSISYTIRRDK